MRDVLIFAFGFGAGYLVRAVIALFYNYRIKKAIDEINEMFETKEAQEN